MKQLVILGGGYGGMRILERIIQNKPPQDLEIILIDRVPYHCLKTEYYALAAGTISDQHVRVPLPEHPQVRYLFDEVVKINLSEKQVILQEQDPVQYDDLIIGLGCENKYHNIPGAEELTYTIQTIGESRETYSALNNLGANQTVGIVGGGLSGVELASELRESRPDLQIKLFDRGEIILSTFPKRLSTYVEKWFLENNVELINNSTITRVEDGYLYNNDEPVQCDAIVWTAGIQPSKVVRDLPIEKDDYGRARLTPHHHLLEDEHVFVVGDCASLPYAPSAQLAEGQGEQIAIVLQKRWNNEELPAEFPPIKLKGVLGSLGKKQGFGLVKERALTGRVPRMLKSGILWMYKNR